LAQRPDEHVSEVLAGLGEIRPGPMQLPARTHRAKERRLVGRVQVSDGDVHGRVLVRPGGSAANAAVWAVEAGATSRVHGRIGSDVAGALLRDELIARGVEPAL